MTQALAHISEDGTRTQTVYDHLSGTAALAGDFARCFDAAGEAQFAGWLHDIGKYSQKFQLRLQGGARVDHSTAGAQEAFRRRHAPAAFAVAGHHSGLPDGGSQGDPGDAPTLLGRCQRKDLPPYDRWQEEVTLPVSAPPDWASRDTLTSAFFTRMLYSCLVDADFIDTETFMNGGEKPRGQGQELPALLAKVRARGKAYLASRDPSPVSVQRNAVLRACMEKGEHFPQGLYTLTVPTGGGKTFASLAFALEHAVAQGMKRVIYVIPYMSIIDQTAAVFGELLGEENVLADYSSAEYKTAEEDSLTPEQYRQLLASENWDAPVVVTTAVQFFESLYANRSSRCRKLHNIADSVIVFDEAQTLPADYLRPCVSAIAQLVQHYHATALLCTATQPVLDPLFKEFAPELQLREVGTDTARLYAVLRRTTLQDLGTLTMEQLSARLSALPQGLCVVNRRKTAQQLYAALPAEGSFCLTTLLCPADRRRKLAQIRQRLAEGLPCRVVSTSLIEAGVDVDFPAAFREQCGLDSLLQTAGRCNREGKRPAEDSPVCRFKLEGLPIPEMLHQSRDALEYTADHNEDLSTPEAIRRYFVELTALRGEASLDKKGILDALSQGIGGSLLPFAEVAKRFHLIENAARTVYIPVEEGAALCQKLRSGFVSRSLLRQLGVYSVSCYASQFNALRDAGALEELPGGGAILTDLDRYSRDTGLSMDVETGVGLFF